MNYVKKTKEEYKVEGLRRMYIRKDKRRAANKAKMDLYGPSRYQICEWCGNYMSWCSVCQVYSSDCCQQYGTCGCS